MPVEMRLRLCLGRKKKGTGKGREDVATLHPSMRCGFLFLRRGSRRREGANGKNVHTIKVSFAWRIMSVKDESRSNASSVPHLAITTPANALHSVKSVCVYVHTYCVLTNPPIRPRDVITWQKQKFRSRER